MWTLVNLVDRFCDQYDFHIVTRNYDSKGDKKPYTTVKTDQWNQTGNAKVFYFSKKNFTQKKFAELVNDHSILLAVILGEDAVEQRGLAGAEVASEHGDGDLVGHNGSPEPGI